MAAGLLERPNLYVVARVVEILHRRGSMKKTQLQMASGLNYSAFLRYLEWFEKHGLVEVKANNDEKGDFIALTTKGFEAYDRLVSWIRQTMEDLQI